MEFEQKMSKKKNKIQSTLTSISASFGSLFWFLRSTTFGSDSGSYCFQQQAAILNKKALINLFYILVGHFKYLGTITDQTLTFNENAESIFKRPNQQLFLIRTLRSFGVSQHVLELAYRSPDNSILSFNITAWYGNLSVKSKNKLYKTVNIAGKGIGKSQKQLCDIFNSAVHRKA